ncbi:hypothetical protein O181_013035 [Austropuccinia psidii MF-1]|uniref:Reverse transcriptase domain-containing protein n=1 Tax=Austropuccinia psidii MF-1 TaxID=1389203 RepID=A0A9Q3GNI3_9BASI|nr:hypothetical protein [Austropuccinia psidii MF-1]
MPLQKPAGNLTKGNEKQVELIVNMLAQAGGQLAQSEDQIARYSIPLTFPTGSKIKKIIRQLPNKKAPGPDKIPKELIKELREVIAYHLTIIFNNCL